MYLRTVGVPSTTGWPIESNFRPGSYDVEEWLHSSSEQLRREQLTSILASFDSAGDGFVPREEAPRPLHQDQLA